jgi:hypothetical protein
MATIDEKIKALETKLKQEKAKKQKMEAMKRAAETKAQRAQDTRKKILLGAFLMGKMEKNPEYAAKVMSGFDSFLKRDDERVLFGLAPMPKPAPDGQSAIQPSPSSRAS